MPCFFVTVSRSTSPRHAWIAAVIVASSGPCPGGFLKSTSVLAGRGMELRMLWSWDGAKLSEPGTPKPLRRLAFVGLSW